VSLTDPEVAMPAKIECPDCRATLTVTEYQLGRTVECRECGANFTAPGEPRPEFDRPAEEPLPPRVRPAPDRRPLPRPRAKNAQSSPVAPIIVGAALFAAIVLGLGIYLVARGVANKKAMNQPPVVIGNPAPFGPVGPQPPMPPQFGPPGMPGVPGMPVIPGMGATKVRLSNPRWGGGIGPAMGGDFQVDYEFTGGRPVGLFSLKWKYTDGTTGSSNPQAFFDARGTLSMRVIGFGAVQNRKGMEIWMEEGGGFGGTKVSNSVNLN
jgi:predicted Zn finger-like uncharacterized protein